MDQDVAAYLQKVKPPWDKIIRELAELFERALPPGFILGMQYGMPTFSVPLTDYPEGYLGRQEPLPFVSIAATKAGISLYHMGLAAMENERNQFMEDYRVLMGRKPDLGKSCLRLADPEKIPWTLLEKLAGKTSPREWIQVYEKAREGRRKKR